MTTATTDAPTAADLRAFAQANGMEVGARGPIPQHVKDAYAAKQAAKAKRRRNV